jgi:hypothetical protein
VTQAIAEKVQAEFGMEYLDELPATIPSGKALVHNIIRPTSQLGLNGFRARLVAADDPSAERCAIAVGCRS